MPIQPISFNSFRGLYLQPNSFSQIPDGSLEVAENVVINRDGMLSKRRGFYQFAKELTNPHKLFEYDNTLFLISGTGIGRYDSLGNYSANSGSGSWTTYKPRIVESGNGVALITSDNGILRIESTTDTLTSAGVPPGLDLLLSTSGQTGFLPPDSQMGYRIVFKRTNAHSQVEVGSPSAFVTVTNAMLTGKTAVYTSTVDVTVTSHGCTSTVSILVADAKDGSGNSIANANGEYTATVVDANTLRYTPAGTCTGLATVSIGWPKTVALEASLPSGLSTSFKYQVFRTEASISDDTSPDEDTLQAVYEGFLTAGQLSAGKLTYSDTVDDLFRGAYCYTNPNTGQGIQNSNDRPPLSKDLALFKGRLFYANTTSKYALSVNLISASVLQVNDTFTTTRSGVTRTYTAKASENAASQQFKRTSGSGSVAFDIADTAQSLCRVINQDTNGHVFAYYISGCLDVPGQIVLQERGYAGSAFSVHCSRQYVFSPDIYTSTISTNETLPHAVYYSKQDEPVHVPAFQYILVGSKDEAILRIVPLRDSLIVVKERSVHRIAGDGVSFLSTILDNTIGCKAENSVCALNNVVHFVCEQGVVGVTESGAQVISREIEPLLTSVVGSQYFDSQTCMVGYESDRTLLLCTIKPGSSAADVVYVRNNATNAWTTSTELFSDALVSRSDDKLVLLSGTQILKERKNLNRLDYCSRSYSITVDSVAADKLSATFTALGDELPEIGDAIVYNSVIQVIVASAAEGATTRFYFTNPVNFVATDTVGHYKYIASRVRIAPLTLGNTSYMKHVSECQIHTRNGQSLSQLQLSFISDSSAGSSPVDWKSSTGTVGWGLQRWGLFAWGNENTTVINYETAPGQLVRSWVPTECARCTWLQTELEHTVAAESVDLQSIGFVARPYGMKSSR